MTGIGVVGREGPDSVIVVLDLTRIDVGVQLIRIGGRHADIDRRIAKAIADGEAAIAAEIHARDYARGRRRGVELDFVMVRVQDFGRLSPGSTAVFRPPESETAEEQDVVSTAIDKQTVIRPNRDKPTMRSPASLASL